MNNATKQADSTDSVGRPATLLAEHQSDQLRSSQTSQELWSQRQYHNEKIYWNLDLFVKVTLAVAGGLAYLSVHLPDDHLEFVSLMVRAGGAIELFTGLILTFNIGCHYSFKIHKLNPPEYNKQLRWWERAEIYIMSAILVTSVGMVGLAWYVAGVYLS